MEAGAGILEDSEINGGGLYVGGQSIVRRVRVIGPSTPFTTQASSLTVSSSLIRSTSDGIVIDAGPQNSNDDSVSTVRFSNVTVIGSGTPGCVGFSVAGTGSYKRQRENATVVNTVVRGCAKSISRVGGAGADGATANLTVLASDLDTSAGAVTQSGFGILDAAAANGNLNADPLFVGLPAVDAHLRFSSPLIDRGLTDASSDESTTDLDGLPRVVDGNGDGTAKRDMGAFEYQRRAPAVTAKADAPAIAIGAPVTFTGSATEADPGETVTGLTWRFDDGGTATGGSVAHSFTKAGAHTATLTATDTAGVAGTATAAVTVTAAINPQPGTARVTRLSLSPAAFRAATRGASVAATKRKRAPVGTRVQFAMSGRASARFTVQRRTIGRRSGRTCVAATKRNRTARTCVRYVAVKGSFTRTGSSRSASFRFTGRIGGKALQPGRYRLNASSGRTPVRRATFTIVS